MSDEQEEPYEPTAHDHAVFAQVLMTVMLQVTQQAYIDGKMDDKTYDTLIKNVLEANTTLKKLQSILDREGK